MRSNGPPGAARKPVPAAGTGALRGLRPGAGVVRAVAVTAAAAAACAMWAAPAGAAVKHASSTHVSAKPTTAYVHASVKLSATVKSKGKTPTGTVTFWSGTRKLCGGHLSKGSTSCAARFVTAAMKTVVGKYSGDATHKVSSGTVHVMIMNKPAAGKSNTTTTITAPNPIATQASGLPYAVKVTVIPAGGGAPTGTVLVAPTNLTNPGPTYSCSFTLTAAMNGSGSCNVTPPKGAYGFTLFQATYEGDAAHNGSATPVAQEHKLINPDSTTTTVAPAAAAAGEVTLTATVVPGGGGNILAGFSETGGDLVTFTVDGTGCTNVALTWNGTVNIAQCVVDLPAGSFPVTAAYSGDEYTYPSQGTETITVS
jgi:large repetitive protein